MIATSFAGNKPFAGMITENASHPALLVEWARGRLMGFVVCNMYTFLHRVFTL